MTWLSIAIAGTGTASGHAITVDGSGADWAGVTPPTQENLGSIARNDSSDGQYIWIDAASDARTDLSSPELARDLVELRITGDATNLYFYARMSDITITSGAGAPQLQIAIDTNRAMYSGNDYFAQYADTKVSSIAEWEWLVQTRYGSGSSTPAVLDTSYTPSYVGSSAISAANEVIEIAIPWSALDFSGPPEVLRFTVVVFAAQIDDSTIDIGDSTVSNALDCLTNYGNPSVSPFPTTWQEVQDQINDYYFDVYFEQNGNAMPPVLVTESLPNPTGTEPNGEWIEIHNQTANALVLSVFKIADEETIDGSEGAARFPVGSVLDLNGFAIIANRAAGTDSFFSKYGFNPNYELVSTNPAVGDMIAYTLWAMGSINLSNTGDEMLLLDGSDTVVDVVTWGTGTWPGVTAIPAPAEGSSIERYPLTKDTDNCTNDFRAQTVPTPGAPPVPPVIPGDMNCDNVLNTVDIPHFVQALIDPIGYDADHDGDPYPSCSRTRADVNLDTYEDGADIQAFVNALLAA